MRALALLVVVAAGCGGSKLSCDVLADPENCWAVAAAATRACLPTPAVGMLAADRASCTFSDGTRVVFDDPLPSNTTELESLGFDVMTAGGTRCARFVDSFQNHLQIEAGGQLAVAELHAGSEFHVHCGGGGSYEGDFDDLFECPAGTAPTDGFSVEPALVTFLISAVTTPGELFRCAP